MKTVKAIKASSSYDSRDHDDDDSDDNNVDFGDEEDGDIEDEYKMQQNKVRTCVTKNYCIFITLCILKDKCNVFLGYLFYCLNMIA